MKSREVSSLSSSVYKYPLKAVPHVVILCKDADMLLLYRLILETCDCRMYEARDLGELRTLAAEAPPALILIDDALPFESTLETIKRIRAESFGRKSRIVLLSGFTQPHILGLARRAGADDFLPKPLDFDQLCDIVRDHAQLHSWEHSR